MDARYLLAVALAAAAAVAACGSDTTGSLAGGPPLEDEGAGTGDGKAKPGGGTTPGGGGTTPGTGTGPDGTPAPTTAPGAQAFYVANVHPFMSSGCGGCHDGPGKPGPMFLNGTDAIKSHAQLLAAGYAIPNSAIVTKGPHGGSTTNALSVAQKGTYEQWVTKEAEERAKNGQPAPANVMEKIGTCFDQAKFTAMNLGQMRTIRRTANNNTNQVTPWNENANQCTGCDNEPCNKCHTQGEANFVMAIGNPIFPADYTISQSKISPYVTKYFGISPDGKPIGSEALKRKALSTQKDYAYSHPMYNIDANREALIKAFVDDAVTKYNAGSCGK